MDDYCDSSNSKQVASKLIKDVIEVHDRGGFTIRNWTSNSNTVNKSISFNLRASNILQIIHEYYNIIIFYEYSVEYTTNITFHKQPVGKTLGLKWDPVNDVFSFNVNSQLLEKLSKESAITKRMMLKMSVFDSLGFLYPFIIRSKILLQSVWRKDIGWDKNLPKEEFDI